MHLCCSDEHDGATGFFEECRLLPELEALDGVFEFAEAVCAMNLVEENLFALLEVVNKDVPCLVIIFRTTQSVEYKVMIPIDSDAHELGLVRDELNRYIINKE